MGKKKCLSCDKLIKYSSTRCKSCETKSRWQNGFNPPHPKNSGQFKKGMIPWSKGLELKEVGYSGLHHRIRRKLGKPNDCKFCFTKSAKVYDWANKSRTYKNDLDDWIRLCRSCHIKYDRGIIYA